MAKSKINPNVENCPFTGKMMNKKVLKDGRTIYKGGPYEKDGYKYTTIVYVTKVKGERNA